MANKLIRIKKLEEKLGIDDYGLRVIVPLDCFYNDEDAGPYWTEEPIKGMEAVFDDESYRRAEHPDGKKAVMGVFHGK